MALFNWKAKEKAAPISLPFNSSALADFFGSTTGSTASVTNEQAMRLNTVYACVKVLSDTMATLPCRLYRETKGGTELHSTSPLDTLMLNSPNEYQTGAEFFSYVMVNLCLSGNFYGYVNRTSSGAVVEILPLKTENVSVQQDSQYNVIYVVTFDDGRRDVMTPDQILHIRGMSMDGVTGVSPIQYNGNTLGAGIDARDYAAKVFTNDATPRGVLHTDGILDDDSFENIKKSWNASHGGVGNSHKVAILEQGLKFQAVSLSPDDVQLLDMRKYTRSEICAMFRVPPHMIGDLDRATFSNIEHQDLAFYKATMLPYLMLIEARLNKALLNVTTQCFKFDTANLLRTDMGTRVETYNTLISAGVMSPNEARKELGYNPREGGDEYVSQSNNLTFGNEGQPKPQEPVDDGN